MSKTISTQPNFFKKIINKVFPNKDALEVIEQNIENLDNQQKVLFKNILNLNDLTAADVMLPRADIISVDIKTNYDGLIKIFNETHHSRLPVYQKTLDHVVGMIHIKDILKNIHKKEHFSLKSAIRKILIIAPSMLAKDLLVQMRQSRIHMALVIDEFGGIDGLVTIEDLVEEIVGEIQDEHDLEPTPNLSIINKKNLIADARVTIEDLEEKIGQFVEHEEREDIDTIGGLVFSLADRIPSRGELIRHPSGLDFEIIEVDPRRIKKVKIHIRESFENQQKNSDKNIQD